MFKKILNNENGGIFIIAAAVVVTLVSFISSAALMNMVNGDHQITQYQHDKIQQELFLRTELTRTKLAIDDNRFIPLPDRVIKMHTPIRRTTYTIDNHKFRERTGYSVQSLIKADRIGKSGRITKSPIKRLTERYLNPKSLAEYQYITHTEASENEDGGFAASLVKFWGPDELYGPVHSNSDIWFQNGGGGNNGGWPAFYAMITTTGRFRKFPGGGYFSENELAAICYGGWQEEVPEVGFSPDAADIRANGIGLGNTNTDIVYINLHDGSFDIKLGVIVEQEIAELDVYSWFPHTAALVNAVIDIGGNWYEDSDLIYTNEITIYDTIWEDASSYPLNNNSFWIEDGELWIEGEVRGATTFGCADTVFIVGDITYEDTPVGSWPDGFSGVDPITHEPLYNGNINGSDYFGLVSEQKILIRYKHTEPLNDPDPPVVSNNGAGVNGGGHVHLYGAYAAIAVGDEALYGVMACHYDGIFTFQYQHEHGSTPNFVAPSPYIREEFSIVLSDAGSNGWDGATMDVIVDGNLIWDDIYCTGSQTTYEFDVDNGDWLQTLYITGGSDDENSYVIYDHNGNAVAGDGPNPDPAGIVPYQALITDVRVDTLYKFVDLHKFIFPMQQYIPNEILPFNLHGGGPIVNNTCGCPYETPAYINSYPNNNSNNYAIPYGTDYPWYNPVWPECSNEIIPFERGILHIYGAVAQTRRGFIHRSGGDPYNHPPGNNEWEMDEYHYDGAHGSTGYDKDYYYDKRFLEVTPPDFPQIHENWGQYNLAGFAQKSWYFKSPGDWGF